MSNHNPWRYCDRDKPPEYVRIQIRDKQNMKYVGYRYKKQYYETIGNYLIKNPYQWRYIPVGSCVWEEIKQRIHINNKEAVVSYEQDIHS